MKIRNQKKRTNATKDKRCPKKPNQQHFPDPSNNAMEVGEMVTMDVHGGTSANLSNSYQTTTDYCHLAWLLQEKLNNVVNGKNGEFQDSPGLRSLLDMAASNNIVSVDPKMLNPILWRTLPKELLHLVLARLPLPDITRLRSLSRGWKSEFAIVNSEINRVCDDATPTMVALLSHSYTDAFFVTIYDITNCRWQSAYHLHLRRPTPWNNTLEQCPHTWTPVDECDGGLVCFISLWKITKSNRLRITVVNLLTRVQHELPPLHYHYKTLPIMVQIKMDSCTKHYKVVVATYRAGDFQIETYDSSTRKWTRAVPSSGFIIGSVYAWATSANGWFYKLTSWTPIAYDFGEGKLQPRTDFRSSNMSDWRLIDMALEKDRMFYLHEKKKRQRDTTLGGRLHQSFHIEEYCLDNRTQAWVKGKLYECPTFEDRGREKLFAVCLNTCDGFLMVIFHYEQRSTRFKLLDLSTGEWKTVPENPNSVGMHTTQSVLCRASWNAIP